MNERTRRLLDKFPRYSFTLIILVAILWLTLAPQPFGDEEIPLFPGADKLIHAIMFAVLAGAEMFDWTRSHGWRIISWSEGFVMALISAVIGIVIEFVQLGMSMGRSFEWLDMVSDFEGAILALLLWKWIEPAVVKNNTPKGE